MTNTQLKHLDLFSGIGGFALAARLAGNIETKAFCEIDPFCTKVLQKHWPDVPVFGDIKNLNYGILQEAGISQIDLISGGFPCQPWSDASKTPKGEKDERHLWPEMSRLISEIRPTWVCGENVYGFIPKYLDALVYDLEDKGYEVWPTVVPACSVGAPQRRYRVWLVAHTNSPNRKIKRLGKVWYGDRTTFGGDVDRRDQALGYSDGEGSQGYGQLGEHPRELFFGSTSAFLGNSDGQPEPESNHQNDSFPDGSGVGPTGGVPVSSGWSGYGRDFKSRLGRATDGVSRWLDRHKWPEGKGFDQAAWEPARVRPVKEMQDRVKRLTALGNAIVPQVAAVLFKAIVEASYE